MAATTLIQSPSSVPALSLGPGLSTHRITNSPIMHMIKSASVKIHSGHSSHSTSLHLQWSDMGRGSRELGGLGQSRLLAGAEEAEELHLDHARVVAGLDAEHALQDDLLHERLLLRLQAQ